MSLLQNGKFDLVRWRGLVEEACDSLAREEEERVEGICPFGFEILQDRSFIRRELRRFYIYIAISLGATPERLAALEERFIEVFRQLVAGVDKQFGESLAVLVRRRGGMRLLRPSGYSPSLGDRLLSVEARQCTDVLLDYAHYVIASAEGIVRGTLPEVQEFMKSPGARSRVFQLFLMLEHLVRGVMPEFEPSSVAWSVVRIKNDIEESFVGGSEPTNLEVQILRDLVIPRLTSIRDVYAHERGPGPSRPKIIRIDAYHGKAELRIAINPLLLNTLVARVVNTYRDYPSERRSVE